MGERSLRIEGSLVKFGHIVALGHAVVGLLPGGVGFGVALLAGLRSRVLGVHDIIGRDDGAVLLSGGFGRLSRGRLVLLFAAGHQPQAGTAEKPCRERSGKADHARD